LRSNAIIVLVLCILAALLLMSWDRQISGGSATSPVLFVGFITLCIGMIIFLVAGRDGFGGTNLGATFALLPLLLVLAYCQYGQWRFHNRPEAVAGRRLAANIRCATEKAGMTEQDRKFISPRLRLIARLGPGPRTREIESRMKIRILPNCGFERLAADPGA
jgi:hypothetical protein